MNKVGTSERTKAVIEPRLSDQWFLKMDELVKPAIKAVLEDEEEIKSGLSSLLDDSVVYNSETKTTDTILGFRNTNDPEDFVNGNSDIKYNDSFVL